MRVSPEEFATLKQRDTSKQAITRPDDKNAVTGKLRLKESKKSVMSEAELTKQIRQYLNARNIWHYKAWQGLMSKKGISDIIGCYKGRFFAIEIKREGGKITEHQQAFINQVRAAGGIAFVAYSIQDVEEYLK
jgi:hypothetical protein